MAVKRKTNLEKSSDTKASSKCIKRKSVKIKSEDIEKNAIEKSELPSDLSGLSNSDKSALEAECETVADNLRSKDFLAHLEKIKSAKRSADEVVGGVFPPAAQASLAITWELVFDHLCAVENMSLSELNTLSGVIHKLSSAKIQLAQDDSSPQENRSPEGIGDDALRKIEERLKLL